MISFQIAPNSVPMANIALQQCLVLLFSRMSAMGVLSGDRITALDAKTVRRAFVALQNERIFSTAAIDVAPLLHTNASELDPAEAKRMETTVGQLAEALEESPAPASEWVSMRETFGDEGLSQLVGVSESSLRRYASSARSTPQEIAERLHWLAMVVADLSGAYNEFGIRRWFERSRPQLGDKSPRRMLGENWTVDDKAANRVRALAAALSGAQPLAV